MDLQSAIIDRLGAGSATEAIVDDRVSWRLRKQGSALPAVVLDTVSGVRTQHLDGFDDMRTTTVQAACLAGTYGESRALAEAVIADLVGEAVVADPSGTDVQFWQGSTGEPVDLGEQTDSEGFLHRAVVDLTLRYAVTE
jgi:hypothetical protein